MASGRAFNGMRLRLAGERGSANYGWLEARYTFSFGEYLDADWMGWRCLRVMNEDRIAGNTGFPSHPHREMEIITIILDGALSHEDSTGSKGVIRQGEVQVMSAGSGIVHSEKNSAAESAHLYQIWLTPKEKGIAPRYDQSHFPAKDRNGKWQLLVSGTGEENSLQICQDAKIYRREMEPNESIEVSLESTRGHWIQVISGDIKINNDILQSSDGIALEGAQEFSITALTKADLLLFDLP
ncbi:MAG: hypothetical protein CBC13_05060 [Planctomycetia bacterium TMED53]|nr:MAG: hypothetical protein CBC13_05060 [Planctomycetia bacterium TMED53]